MKFIETDKNIVKIIAVEEMVDEEERKQALWHCTCLPSVDHEKNLEHEVFKKNLIHVLEGSVQSQKFLLIDFNCKDSDWGNLDEGES